MADKLWALFRYNETELEPLFCVYDNATHPNRGMCSYLNDLVTDSKFVALEIGESSYGESFTSGSESIKGDKEVKQIQLLIKVEVFTNRPVRIIENNRNKENLCHICDILNSENDSSIYEYRVIKLRGKWSVWDK